LSADLAQQLFPLAIFLLVLLHDHALLGVPALEVGLVDRAVQTELAEKLLPFRAEKIITEEQGSMRVGRVGRESHSARIGGHDIHRHPFDRRAFRDRYARVAEKNRGRGTPLAGDTHVESRPSRHRAQTYRL